MPLHISQSPFETDALRDCISKWEDFRARLERNSSVAIVYHGDADGAVAAAVLDLIIATDFDHPPLLQWVGTDEYDFGELRCWLSDSRPTHLIFLDVSIENEPGILTDIVTANNCEVFVFDHHLLRTNKCVKNVLLANPTPSPLKPNEVPVPSFAFAWKLANTAGFQFPEWLMTFLCFAEGIDAYIETFLRKLISQVWQIEPDQSLRAWYQQSQLVRIGNLVRAAFSEGVKDNGLVRTLQKGITENESSCQNFVAELERRFASTAQRISRDISNLVSEYELRLPTIPEPLLLIRVDNVHAVAGPVASILRGKAPEKVILTWIRKGTVIVCELRTGLRSNLNLVDILSVAARQVPMINYGGHASAAGALIYEKSFDSFIEALKVGVSR